MAHQIVLSFDVRARPLEPCPATVIEGVPADRAGPSPYCGWFDLPIEDALPPIGFLVPRSGKMKSSGPLLG